MANLAFRSVASDGDNTFGSSTDSATVPAGTVENDLEVIWYASGTLAPAAAPTHTTPAGWTSGGTLVANGVSGGLINLRVTLYYRLAPASPAAATLDSGVSAVHAWVRASYDNPDLAGAFGQVTFDAYSGAVASIGPITTTKANALVMMFVVQGAANTIVFDGSLIERVDNAAAGVSLADLIQASAGGTGAQTATGSAGPDGVAALAEFWSESGPPIAVLMHHLRQQSIA